MSSFDRLVARTLRQPAATETPCPAPETLAACVEHNLSRSEREAVERHASSCARCARHLAALVQLDDQLAAGHEVTPAPSPWRRRWTWLVPVAASVVVFAVWTSMPEERKSSFTAPPAKNTPVSTSRPDTRPATEPPLEAAHASPVAGKRPATAERGKADTISTGASPATGSTLGHDAPKPPARAEQRRAVPMLDTLSPAAKEAAAQEPTAPSAAAAAPAAPPAESKDKAAPVPEQEAAPPLQKAAPVTARERDAGTTANAQSVHEEVRQQRFGLAAVPALVRSPDPQVLWRFTPPAIERSTDGGRTWSAEPAPPLPRQVSGSAPSRDVCWVAGEEGFVARRDRSGKWTQTTTPASVRLVHVAARSALEATVTTADDRVFSTRDGGITWTADR